MPAGRGRLEAVEIKHIAKTTISKGGTEDRDVVLGGPVADGALVVDLQAETADELAGCPAEVLVAIIIIVAITSMLGVSVSVVGASVGVTLLLLGKQAVQDRNQPVLERAVVVVWDDEVADPVHALFAQSRAGHAEGAEVRLGQAFDEVFLDAAGRRHDGGDVLVLDEVADRLAQAGRDQVRRVAEEDCRFGAGVGVTPCLLDFAVNGWSCIKHALYIIISIALFAIQSSIACNLPIPNSNKLPNNTIITKTKLTHHIVHNPHRIRHRTGLEAHTRHPSNHLLDRDGRTLVIVKLDSTDGPGVFGNGTRGFEDCGGGGGGGSRMGIVRFRFRLI